MVVLERPIGFDEVDAAGIVYFPRFLGYAHEAMERLFAGLDGGYARLVTARRIGLPAVRVETDFASPVRYGDVLRIEASVAKLGTRSAVLRYRMTRADGGALVAEVRHTVVVSDLAAMRSCDMPADLRAALEAHLEAAPP
jgi:4-hydroxybenzoyl-CoA thioesterase